jgi:hypothetical protein
MRPARVPNRGLEQTSERPAAAAANHAYYFDVGAGVWRGSFAFRVTSPPGLRRARIGLQNRLLVAAVSLFARLAGQATIDSTIWADPGAGRFGRARNVVRLHRLGITVYLLKEEYRLDPNGRDVEVRARERFGPIPFLFRNEKTHPAVIEDGGRRSTYFMPLLGDDWTAKYVVSEDGRHIDGRLESAWAEAIESMDKVAQT